MKELLCCTGGVSEYIHRVIRPLCVLALIVMAKPPAEGAGPLG